jgi:hypothetical protein
MDDLDLDLDHYTIDDLTKMLDIKEITRESVIQATESVIQQYEKNKDLVDFFTKVQERLLNRVHAIEPPIVATFQSEIKRGTINPDLKNTVTRFINIDSSCRMLIEHQNLSSDSFDFELTETLLNVVSIALYSVEIPYAWFNNTASKGTTGLVVCHTIVGEGLITETIRTPVQIPEGNYSTNGLPAAVAAAITAATEMTCISYVNPTTGIAIFELTLKPVVPARDTSLDVIQILWFDVSYATNILVNSRYNSNLGWMLGFRSPLTTFILIGGKYIAVPISPVDANGTKYIIMSLNDYKTNRINRSLLCVNTFPNITLQTPSYFNASIPQVRTTPTQVNALESNPRQLTAKQVYTINAIAGQQSINRRFISHLGSDTFAKIPFKKTDWNKHENGQTTVIDNGPGKLFVDTSGPLQLQMREYFGPVDITQLSISLYDDKGHPLNLNGFDWSCTLMVKCIYQY